MCGLSTPPFRIESSKAAVIGRGDHSIGTGMLRRLVRGDREAGLACTSESTTERTAVGSFG